MDVFRASCATLMRAHNNMPDDDDDIDASTQQHRWPPTAVFNAEVSFENTIGA